MGTWSPGPWISREVPEHMFSFLFGAYIEVGLLNYRLYGFVILTDALEPSSIVLIPVRHSTSKVQSVCFYSASSTEQLVNLRVYLT